MPLLRSVLHRLSSPAVGMDKRWPRLYRHESYQGMSQPVFFRDQIMGGQKCTYCSMALSGMGGYNSILRKDCAIAWSKMQPSNLVLALRNKFDLSQEELARAIKVSYTTVNAWETGKRKPQEHMLSMLEEMYSLDSLPSEYSFKSNYGLVRSDAGYVSSILDYGIEKDPNQFTHGIGRWYGCLPSFLVNDLLGFLTTDFNNSGEALVNFSGSGTVALELSLRGRKSVAIDVNPTAIALTRMKTIIPEPGESVDFTHLREMLGGTNEYPSTSQLPQDNLLVQDNRWLSAEAKRQIIAVCAAIANIEDYYTRELVALAAASIIVDFSNIDKRCTNHYVYKQNKAFEIERFIDEVIKQARDIEERRQTLTSVKDFAQPEVMWGDACSLPFDGGRFSLVFSHPPYGTTVNYYSISRMQSSVIELVSFMADSTLSMGLKQCKDSDISSGTLKRFSELSKSWVSEAARVLIKGGLLLTIIGDSRNGGKLSHPFTEVIAEGERNGLVLKEIFIWVTNQKSGMHVKRKGNHIDHNYIIIMEKQDD